MHPMVALPPDVFTRYRRKFENLLGLPKTPVPLQPLQPHDRVRSKTVLRMVAMPNQIQIPVNKSHTLRLPVPPHLGNHLHCDFPVEGHTRHRRAHAIDFRSLLRRIQVAPVVKTHRHP